MSDPVRIGIIGCGQVTRAGHGPAIDSDRRAMIAAVADPDDENRSRLAKKYRVPLAYADHRDMLAKAELDAVVITSPPWLHLEHFSDCIDAGLHILCEKPLARTADECREMISLSNKTDKVVLAGHAKRFETGFQKIKEILDRGDLGRMYQMTVHWHFFIPDFSKGWLRTQFDRLKAWGIDLEKKYGTWRYLDPRAGGGIFYDHAPHYIDLVRLLVGEMTSVFCKTRQFIEVRVHDDLAVAVFTLENEALLVLDMSNLMAGRPSGYQKGIIACERGKIRFDVPQAYERKTMTVSRYTPYNIIPDIYTPVRVPSGEKNSMFFRQMSHFIDKIRGEKTVITDYNGEWASTITDGALAVLWTLAGFTAAKEGREIFADEVRL